MDTKFSAALRRAAALTRAGDLHEATRTISAALGAATPPPADHGPNPPSARIRMAPAIGPSADRADERADVRGEAGAGGGARRVRPLHATIRDLAAGRRIVGAMAAGPRSPGPPATPAGARYLARDFAVPEGARAYRLYVPASAAGGVKGLVLMLHGCRQTPDDFAVGTSMNERAEAAGLVVVYPAQPTSANGSACWNWFRPEDQRRGCGEPAILAGLARSVAAEFDVPAGNVHVAGLSAGGAMAAILADVYPDVFAAAGIHSGLPAGAAVDVASAFAAMAGRRRAGGVRSTTAAQARLIVFHGTADDVVHPSNGAAIVDARVRAVTATERVRDRTQAGRRFERIVHRNAAGLPVAEHWIVEGQGHAWSGGRTAGSYTDPDGPDASAEMIRFFLEDGT